MNTLVIIGTTIATMLIIDTFGFKKIIGYTVLAVAGYYILNSIGII
jgi:hypothetical protein